MNTPTPSRLPERRVHPRGPNRPGQRLLFGVLRWIAGHVRGFYAAVGVFLFIPLALLVVAGIAFAELAENVMEGQTQQVDNAILLWMNDRASTHLTGRMLDITALGAGTVVWVVVVVASVFFWSLRHRLSAVLLWVALLGSGLINSTLKALFDRPRPDLFEWRTPYAGQESFPSGHSMTAMVAYTTLAFLIARLEPSKGLKRFTFFVAAVIITGVGISRMYLGVHYPTDVIGGFMMGIAWAAVCALAFEAIRYFRGRKPDLEEVEEKVDASATGDDPEVEAEKRSGVGAV